MKYEITIYWKNQPTEYHDGSITTKLKSITPYPVNWGFLEYWYIPSVFNPFSSCPRLVPLPNPNQAIINITNPKQNKKIEIIFKPRLSGSAGKLGHFRGRNKYMQFI
jgi:hypothetical protein